jgi:8-oxo-dGTP pyrophosphatase MutT (NUDIX family)
MAKDKLFHVGQKAVIEKDGQILILHNPQMGIDLPGGKIQEGETDFIESLKREVFEETGLTVTIHNPFHTGYFEHIKDKSYRNGGKKIFLVFFKATFTSGEIVLSEEHDNYQWIDKKSYKKLKQVSGGNVLQALKRYFND